MMNWCSKHECFQICPECNRELAATIESVAKKTAELFPRNAGTPDVPYLKINTQPKNTKGNDNG